MSSLENQIIVSEYNGVSISKYVYVGYIKGKDGGFDIPVFTDYKNPNLYTNQDLTNYKFSISPYLLTDYFYQVFDNDGKFISFHIFHSPLIFKKINQEKCPKKVLFTSLLTNETIFLYNGVLGTKSQIINYFNLDSFKANSIDEEDFYESFRY